MKIYEILKSKIKQKEILFNKKNFISKRIGDKMITGIIFASGFSRRMGKDKLLLEIEGEKIIERVIRASVESDLDGVILVYRKDEIKEIGKNYGLKTIYNHKADKGQSESMRLGIKNTIESSSYMFIVGDQPFLNSDIINKLIYEYKSSKSSILIPYYNGERGMPMIMSNIYKDELLNVVGDKGGRDIVRKYSHNVHKVNIEEERLGIDIDTIDDLTKI